jgi:hypothetical protein
MIGVAARRWNDCCCSIGCRCSSARSCAGVSGHTAAGTRRYKQCAEQLPRHGGVSVFQAGFCRSSPRMKKGTSSAQENAKEMSILA